MEEFFPDQQKARFGAIAQGLALLYGLYYGVKNKRKFWYYVVLFLVVAPLIYAVVYQAAPQQKED
jgi:hypothetical protein